MPNKIIEKIPTRFRPYLKWFSIILGGLLILIIIVLSIADYYISSNKTKVIALAKEKIEESTNGAKVSIGDLDVSVWRDFPRLRLSLREVDLRDSVFKSPLLHFGSVSTKVNLIKALFGNFKLNEIRLINGEINILTDSTGYTNTAIFDSKKKKTEKKDDKNGKTDLNINKLYIENVHFVLDDPHKDKHYGIIVNKINALINPSGDSYNVGLAMDTKVEGLGFNMVKGPFLKNKSIIADWNNMKFNGKTGDLTFDKTPVKIDGHVFNIGGGFNFSNDSAKSLLNLKVDSKATTFKDCASLLAANIQTALSNYSCSNKVDVIASLYGSLQQSTPHVLVKLFASNSDIKIKSLGAELDSCSFVGNYNNQNDKKQLPDDKNSTIVIDKFKGNITGVPFQGIKMNVLDLVDPYLDLALLSQGDLVKLNRQLELQTMQFLGGQGRFAIAYKGRVPSGIGLMKNLSCELSVKDGKASYTPKGLLFENCNGVVSFGKNNLTINNLRATLNNNTVFVNLNGHSVISNEKGSPSLGYIDCDINAPYLNLGYFSKLFQEGKKSNASTSNKKSNQSSGGGLAASSLQVDELLKKGEFRLNMHSKQIKYNNFSATAFVSKIIFKDNDWYLKQFDLNHAGGHISINGVVNTYESGANRANVNLNLNKVQLDKLLYAFDNFGINGLSYKNLKGIFTAKAKINTLIDKNGNMVDRSTVGSISFNLAQGELINYPPLLSIKKFVFKNRDLNDVKFANINNTILIRKGNFFINRMEIASTALRLFVEGIYSPTGNSDISVQVPFSSLLKKKSKEEALDKLDPNEKAGASVYLRATNKNGGPMGVKVDLFKKLRKDNIKEQFEKEFGKED